MIDNKVNFFCGNTVRCKQTYMWDSLTVLVTDRYVELVIGSLSFVTLILLVMTKNSAASQVAERRLRPIYDWLDTGNNKKALQEADKVLKKQPDFQCCKVLKCLALIRLGKEEEAETILNKVRAFSMTSPVSIPQISINRFWMKFRWMKAHFKP